MAQIYRARLRSAEGTAKELVIKRVLPIYPKSSNSSNVHRRGPHQFAR